MALSLRIRRRLKKHGLPYLQINALTTNAKIFRKREQLVDDLIAGSQWEVLRALHAGTVAITTIEAHAREYGLGGAGLSAQIVLSSGLWATIEETLPKMGKSEKTRARYALSRDQLRARLPMISTTTRAIETFTVRELLSVDWQELRDVWPGGASDWMHMRRFLSRFLSLALGFKQHPTRYEILNRIPTEVEEERVPDLSPEQFRRLVAKARPDMRPAFWTIVLTGMRTGEYLRCDTTHLRADVCQVQVPGSKTAGAKGRVTVAPRYWKWVVQGVPCPVRYKRLRELYKAALKAAGLDETLRLHDLRHCHGQWAVDGGAAESSVQVSLRHTQMSTTRRYTKKRNLDAVADGLAAAVTPTPRKTS